MTDEHAHGEQIEDTIADAQQAMFDYLEVEVVSGAPLPPFDATIERIGLACDMSDEPPWAELSPSDIGCLVMLAVFIVGLVVLVLRA